MAVGSGGITTGSFADGAIDSGALATTADNEIADALLDRTDGIETGLTVRGALRILCAMAAGKLSGAIAGSTTVIIRNAVSDTKARITADCDANGNRTAITWDTT